MLTTHDIARLLDKKTADKGRRYWADDAVTPDTLSDLIVTGQVQGSERLPYDVEVALTQDALLTRCACPVGVGCKHAAALLYALADDPTAFTAVTLDAQPLALIDADDVKASRLHAEAKRRLGAVIKAKPKLEDVLAKMDHAALVDLTRALVAELEDGQRWVQRWLEKRAGKFEPIEARIKHTRRALDRADSSAFNRLWRDAKDEASALASHARYDDALQLSGALVDWVLRAIDERQVDDWELLDALNNHGSWYVQQLWEGLVEAAPAGYTTLAQHIVARMNDGDEYGMSWSAGEEALLKLVEKMSREERDALRALVEQELDDTPNRLMIKLEDQPETPAERAAQRWRYKQHADALTIWLDAGLRDEALRHALTLSWAWNHLDLFDARGDHDAVAKLLDAQIKQGVAGGQDIARWVDALVALDRGAEAWRVGVELLAKRPNARLIAALERGAAHIGRAGDVEAAIVKALKDQPSLLLSWRLDRGELAQAALAWDKRKKEDVEVRADVLERLSDALRADHPATCMRVLCARADALMRERTGAAYQEAAQLAAQARALADEAGVRADFDRWLTALLTAYKGNNHVKSPFKKQGMVLG